MNPKEGPKKTRVNPAARRGAFLIWPWGDSEIENPRNLRLVLDRVYEKGFAGVLVMLTGTRYELMDAKVVSSIVQASQWARSRGIPFWFQADPRHASRSLILKTGERLQNLIVFPDEYGVTLPAPGGGKSSVRREEDPCIRAPAPLQDAGSAPAGGWNTGQPLVGAVKDNRFQLFYRIPAGRSSVHLLEKNIVFEPSGLERCFLFQMKDRILIRDSVRDITRLTRFFANIPESRIEIFGEVGVPQSEPWWVTAFPRFDTNLFDYAGRESNDALIAFIEALFDSGAIWNGVTWGYGGTCGEQGRFPVSLSLYNSFIADYGYDLRNVLYNLVLDADDGSHVRVREDYYNLLMETIDSAQNDFRQNLHGFFGDMEIGRWHAWGGCQGSPAVCGSLDPWHGMDRRTVCLTCLPDDGYSQSEEILTGRLAMTRSLGLVSEHKKAFMAVPAQGPVELDRFFEMAALFSVRCMTEYMHDRRIMDTEKWLERFEEFNKRAAAFEVVTGYQFAETNTAVVFPVDTLIGKGFDDSECMSDATLRLIARMIRSGIQLDVLSSRMLGKGRLTSQGFSLGERNYQAIVYPYPEVVGADALEGLAILLRFGFPLFMGKDIPRMVSGGKRIPHEFKPSFDPETGDVIPLLLEKAPPPLSVPENAIGAWIKRKHENLVLVLPARKGDEVQGRIVLGKRSFDIQDVDRLAVFQAGSGSKPERVF